MDHPKVLAAILGLVLDFRGIHVNPIEFARHVYMWVCRAVPSSALTTPRELCYCLRNLAVPVSVVSALPFAMGRHTRKKGHLENMGKNNCTERQLQNEEKKRQPNKQILRIFKQTINLRKSPNQTPT